MSDVFDYVHDHEGRQVKRTHRDSGEVTAYHWDSLGRLEQVAGGDGSVVEYRYDPLGRRVAETRDGETTWYRWTGEHNLSGTYRDDGTQIAGFTALPSMDATISMRSNGMAYQLHADAQGTVTSLADSAGGLVEYSRYTAFGEALTGPSVAGNPFGWQALPHDPGTGLTYARHRYYRPSQGRFISEDPVPSVNPYEFGFNNPTAHTDPSGAISMPTYSAGTDQAARIAAIVLGTFAIGSEIMNNGTDLDAWLNTGVQIAGGYASNSGASRAAVYVCGTPGKSPGDATKGAYGKSGGIACFAAVGATTGAMFGTVFKLTATAILEPEELTPTSVLGAFLASLAGGAGNGISNGAFGQGLISTMLAGRNGRVSEKQWEQLEEFLKRPGWD